uniref:Uncharacterized protein n=1 Tax=Anguilla anguilla TaxID=7936 RepID=A0A0E9S5F0_ANGAN
MLLTPALVHCTSQQTT